MKTYLYKIYDASDNYIKDWQDVVSDPEYTAEINSAGSELKIILARKGTDFGEEDDVKFRNKVKIYVKDNEASTPTLFFQGYISNYEPVFDIPEQVEITLLSYGSELGDYLYTAAASADQSSVTEDDYSTVSGNQRYAQSFVPTVDSLDSVDLKLYVDQPVNATLTIETNNSNAPSGVVVSGSTVNKSLSASTPTVTRFQFESPISVTIGAKYWIVVTT